MSWAWLLFAVTVPLVAVWLWFRDPALDVFSSASGSDVMSSLSSGRAVWQPGPEGLATYPVTCTVCADTGVDWDDYGLARACRDCGALKAVFAGFTELRTYGIVPDLATDGWTVFGTTFPSIADILQWIDQGGLALHHLNEAGS